MMGTSDNGNLERHKRDEFKTGWPSGLRRWIKAPISSGAWVRVPLQSILFHHSSRQFEWFMILCQDMIPKLGTGKDFVFLVFLNSAL